MKGLLSLLFVFSISASAFAQTYTAPIYEKRDYQSVEIKQIKITKDYTIVDFLFVSPASYNYGGWICAMEDFYIRDCRTGEKYFLEKTNNIPICPAQKTFNRPGIKYRFQLYFPKLKPTVEYIDLIEEHDSGFNFYRVHLKPIA